MTISLKKTVVMPVEAHKPPRILINTSLLKVVVKPSVSLDDEINQRLGKLSTNFGRLSSSWNNHHLTEVRVYSACPVMQQRDVVHNAHTTALSQLHHPACQWLTQLYRHHEAATSALAGPCPSYWGNDRLHEGHPLRRIS